MKSILKAVCALAPLAAALNAGEPEIKPDDFRNVYGIAWRGDCRRKPRLRPPDGLHPRILPVGHGAQPKGQGIQVFYRVARIRGISARNRHGEKIFSGANQMVGDQLLTPEPRQAVPVEYRPRVEERQGVHRHARPPTKEGHQGDNGQDNRAGEKIEEQTPGFKFAGFAWDVPQPAGDFWTGRRTTGSRTVAR